MEAKKALLGAAIVIITGLFLAVWSRSSQEIREFKQEKLLLDTYVSVTVYGRSETRAGQAIKEAFLAMEKIDKTLNRYNPKSEVSRLNQAAGVKEVKVSPDTLKVIQLALKYNRLTNGAFDITVGPLVSLWDFNKRKVPGTDKIKQKLALVGAKNIQINAKNSTVRLLKRGMVLDLGGIAKGYAADKAVAALKKWGISKALVSTGSTTVFLGQKLDGPFKVGIQNPRKSEDIIGVLNLKNKSISTSGDYQQYFVKSGRRYNHIINPKTGRPATSTMSVTIITDRTCAEADILSTAVFVMGYPRGKELLSKLKGTSAVIVTSKGKIFKTKGVAPFLESLEKNI